MPDTYDTHSGYAATLLITDVVLLDGHHNDGIVLPNDVGWLCLSAVIATSSVCRL